MQLTLETENPKLLALIEELARHLGVSIRRTTGNGRGEMKAVEKNEKGISNSAEAVKALEELAKLGTFNSVKDPVAWQREIRNS